MTRITTLLLISLGLTTGCSVDIEELVTIEQGIYGQYSYYEYAGNSAREVATQNALVSIFAPEDGVTLATYDEYLETGTSLPAALITTSTDNNGFFEFNLDAGDYLLCVGERPLIADNSEQAADIDLTEQPELWDMAMIAYEPTPTCTAVSVDQDTISRYDMISDGWGVTWL